MPCTTVSTMSRACPFHFRPRSGAGPDPDRAVLPFHESVFEPELCLVDHAGSPSVSGGVTVMRHQHKRTPGFREAADSVPGHTKAVMDVGWNWVVQYDGFVDVFDRPGVADSLVLIIVPDKCLPRRMCTSFQEIEAGREQGSVDLAFQVDLCRNSVGPEENRGGERER